MSPVHRGKIGRLPKNLRDEVNRRLEDGERASSIAAWLNALPGVQAMLAAEFDGQSINEKNISSWRKYGYRHWSLRREAEHMSAEIGALPVAANSPVPDQVTTWASVRYLMTVRELIHDDPDRKSRLKALRELCRDSVTLRRADYRRDRLHFDQDRLAGVATACRHTADPTHDFSGGSDRAATTPKVGQASRLPSERFSASGISPATAKVALRPLPPPGEAQGRRNRPHYGTLPFLEKECPDDPTTVNLH